ncbi:hypothetical protein TSUD_47260 [Trifolium subterraneum]|nr:hypothetical protein TSUD_47260 [Trifolium subterraneum]
MLRYSDRSIFGLMEQLPWFPMENGQSVTEVDPFNRVLGNLMKKLKEKAASSNDSCVKYATDKESDASLNFQTIYGLVQCTPDLSFQDCLDCLNGAIAYLPVSKYGGRVVEPSCNIRYESWRFYDPPLVVDPDDTSQPQEKSRSSSHTTTIAIGVSTVVVVVVLLTLIICICLRRNRHSMARLNLEGQEKNDEFEAEASKDLKVGDLLQFDMETVKLATSNFSDANKLGQGGFGTVYKGMLANGQNVAIKRLAINSNQGETEFKNEVLLTGKLQHRNLVKLLDEEMNPKITDFGIAKLFDASQTHGMTKTVVGTFGYMAPEYVRHGKFSIKSDVFSYGIIILEIVCGRRIIKNRDGEFIEDLLSIAWRNWKAGTISDIIDPLLDHGCNKNEKLRSIHVGLLCVQEDIDMRPAMSLVLLMLSSIYFPLPEPLAPPLLMQPKRTLSKVLSDQYSGLTKSTDPGSTSKYSVTD